MDVNDIVEKLVILVLVFGSVILHEIAHGYVAWRLGDPTARMQGRITLNPLAHIDMFGTIIVPILMSFGGGPVLGWAKPVPFNPSYFRDPKRGIMLTGAAGPATNFAIALVAVIAFKLIQFLPVPLIVLELPRQLCMINIYLGLFNLIPIPPLDGSRVATGLIPDSWVGPYLSIERYGLFIVVALLYGGVFRMFLHPVADFIFRLLLK
jgi:Zn-dependent protease